MAGNFLNSFFSIRSPEPTPPAPSGWTGYAQHWLQDGRVHVPLSLLGLYTACCVLIWLARSMYIFLKPSGLPRSLHPSGQRYLTYALVTGSTDGIGRALAWELSRRGFALVLHGRNASKLETLVAEIHAAHKSLGAPRPRTLLATADATDEIDFAALVAPLRTLRLTVLVNNVGAQGHLAADPFRTLDAYSRSDIDRLLELNAIFMVQLTRELLPVLLRASDPALPDNAFDYPVKIKAGNARKAGAVPAPTAQILNASSAAALGGPYVAPYAGSKGFVEALTRAMRNEFHAEHLPRDRIDAIALRIGNVVTNTNVGAVRLFMPSADTYAKAICDRVGCGAHVVVPYFWHWVQITFFASLVGDAVVDLAMVMNMRWRIREYRELVKEKQEGKPLEEKEEEVQPAPTTKAKGGSRRRKQ